MTAHICNKCHASWLAVFHPMNGCSACGASWEWVSLKLTLIVLPFGAK